MNSYLDNNEMIRLQFRHAVMSDAEMLFRWRNDYQTRKQSHNTKELIYTDHLEWLATSLVNPDREIRIALWQGQPVGSIRLDAVGNEYELSWAVAPEARGKGIGKAMLKITVDSLNRPARAQVKADNLPSRRMAEYAGMVLEREENSILHYHVVKQVL